MPNRVFQDLYEPARTVFHETLDGRLKDNPSADKPFDQGSLR